MLRQRARDSVGIFFCVQVIDEFQDFTRNSFVTLKKSPPLNAEKLFDGVGTNIKEFQIAEKLNLIFIVDFYNIAIANTIEQIGLWTQAELYKRTPGELFAITKRL